MKSSHGLVCAEDPQPLIPDGIYEAVCYNYSFKTLFGRTRKLFLNFRIITEGKHHGVELFKAFNLPNDGKIRRSSNYYKTWCQISGCIKPSRNAKMSPTIFKNKTFKIRTRPARPKHDGKVLPKEHWYSVVDTILEQTT
jgi:hypothetical protein